jgi:hypothetical protein
MINRNTIGLWNIVKSFVIEELEDETTSLTIYAILPLNNSTYILRCYR